MATYTSRLGLRRPDDSDYVDQELDLNQNFDKIDAQFDPSNPDAHNHDGVNSRKISHNNLTDLTTGDPHPQYVRKDKVGVAGGVAPVNEDGEIPEEYIPQVTDEKLGTRTVNQGITANPSNTGLLTQILSWLAQAIKNITGKTNWFEKPAVTLEETHQHILNMNNPHNTTAAQVGAIAVTEKSSAGGAEPFKVAMTDADGAVGRANSIKDGEGNYRTATNPGGVGANKVAVTDDKGAVGRANALNTGNGYVGGSVNPTPNTVAVRDLSGRMKAAAPVAADDVARKAEVDLKMDKGGGAFTGPVVFQDAVTFGGEATLGDSNSDVVNLVGISLPIDTRTLIATSWHPNGKPSSMELRDGDTVVATITFEYNDEALPTKMVVTAGGKIITWNQELAEGGRFIRRTKEVK